MAQKGLTLPNPPAVVSTATLERIMKVIQAHAMTMIYLANHREDAKKGDPKVGGHPSACSSALHLLSTLHLTTRNPQDFVAVKPHASPTDHTNHYLMRLFAEPDGKRMNDDRMRIAMRNLRHYSSKGEPVLQSYHSAFDPDHWNFFPSGSVGIPPVQALYLAHAFRMAKSHGHDVPEDAHFWCLMGDSEYREGSLMEALPEASERAVGNLTWIVDYNRQSLDGHRILNEEALGGKDNDRIEKTALANGWDVIQLRHGRFRQEILRDSKHGEALQNALPDYEFQSLLSKKDAKTIVEAVAKYDKGAADALKALDGEQLVRFWRDLGGHDVEVLREAYAAAKKDADKPMLLVAHTIKGWNLRCEAQSANHSAMLTEDEVHELRAAVGLENKDLHSFEQFAPQSPEGLYLKSRGDWFWNGIQEVKKLKEANIARVSEEWKSTGGAAAYPVDSGINLKLLPLAHTQWMLGQVTAKLVRVSETPLDAKEAEAAGKKPLSDTEKRFKAAANLLVTMAPDVGTSTNLNSSMDGRIYGPESEDFEGEYGVKDNKAPDIVPHESEFSRHIRFEIAEGNAMTCVGSYGKLGDAIGVPYIPIMTVYDFFLKRALDQLFYNAYWKSSFIAVGTPAGVTLSPEGAQHAWKSDIQIANMVTWEPSYCLEFDWILTESMRRHMNSFTDPNTTEGIEGRSAVLIRGVTRALDQKEMLKRLKYAKRFEGQADDAILEATRKDCLEGAWYVVDHRGQPGYRPSENVVHIFSMGSLITEALEASDALLKEGLFANVIQVSSPDLLLGNQGYATGFRHLKQGLGITGDLFLRPQAPLSGAATNGKTNGASYPPAQYGPKPFERITLDAAGSARLWTLGGRRIPIVSVHDGEAGLLDNIGSCVGTIQKSLAVRKHSKSGRPVDVFHYHGIDAEAVAQAAKSVLEESAFSGVQLEVPGSSAGSETLGSSFVQN
jgi:pyruvate dehydrogenase E1 component